MIRPTSLYRSDSDRREFSAPASNIRQDTIDCGITAIPCCLPSYFQRFATPKIFIFFFIILGIVQGSTQAYFASTVRYVGEIFNYSNEFIDWLLIANEIFQGVFVLIVAHWGNKINRIAWLGGLTCLQGCSCFLVFIPYLEHLNSGNQTQILTAPSSNLCDLPKPFSKLEIVADDGEYCWITLVVLFILQLFIALANSSFFTHGFSYIDDNVEQINSPVYIASALSVKMTSLQFGSFMAWSFLNRERSWWIGYPILGSLLILMGTIIATFPKKLMNTLLKQTAASIFDIATRNTVERQISEITPKTDFFPTFRRLVTNKIIIINAIATVLLEMGIKNFAWYEDKFMEAQYYLPIVGKGFQDPWTSRLVITILKPPIMTLAMLVTGLILAKVRPRTKCVAIWCVLTTLMVVGFCLSYGFMDCKKDKITGEFKEKFLAPYCSSSCNCMENSNVFEPVCIQGYGGTYYSPCYAGCKNITYINDVKLYSNCSCGGSYYGNVIPRPTLASEGACNNAKCAIHYKMFQAFTVISSALLGSGYVANFFINLRAVYHTDKAMAIGFELFLTGILVHVPGKILYKFVSDVTCQFSHKDGYSCSLHSEKFGDIISYLTAGLLLASAIFDIVIVFICQNVELFTDDDDDSSSLPMQQMSRLAHIPEARDSGFATPARASVRSSNIGSAASTLVQSIEYSTPEEQPLTREQHQRNVVSELKARRSTNV
ncbi:organic anion transporting polypeptide 33Eb [Arctopsyche grandis]|uniref:organic anion transporting polypeptide 33Eb n=1 Tax=Arctopsyche grandis TaxID=121162 RepID=UPI00406D9E40